MRRARAGLLERLVTAGSGGDADDRRRLLASVRRNLMRILNSRQGSAPAQMDLGTLPPNEILQGLPEAMERIQSSLRHCIEDYEPRLRSVSVVVLETAHDPLSVHFLIRGHLCDDTTPINFETQVDRSGRIVLAAR